VKNPDEYETAENPGNLHLHDTSSLDKGHDWIHVKECAVKQFHFSKASFGDHLALDLKSGALLTRLQVPDVLISHSKEQLTSIKLFSSVYLSIGLPPTYLRYACVTLVHLFWWSHDQWHGTSDQWIISPSAKHLCLHFLKSRIIYLFHTL